jgi:hypothetical protein
VIYEGFDSSKNHSQNNRGYGGCTIGTVVERDCFNIKNTGLPTCQKAFKIVKDLLKELPKENMPSPRQIIATIRTIGNMCVE